jgi:hypothetical protein
MVLAPALATAQEGGGNHPPCSADKATQESAVGDATSTDATVAAATTTAAATHHSCRQRTKAARNTSRGGATERVWRRYGRDGGGWGGLAAAGEGREHGGGRACVPLKRRDIAGDDDALGV